MNYERDEYGFPIETETTEFLDAPIPEEPPVIEKKPSRPRVYWPVMEKLLDHPGVWYKIKIGKLSTLRAIASNLKLGKTAIPEGEWEFIATPDPDFPHSNVKGALYAKYIGPKVEVPVVEEKEEDLDSFGLPKNEWATSD